jgi:DNA-binding XRE family transcriptional regulator
MYNILKWGDILGDILQKARDGKSWSQKDLAEAAGLELDEVRRMERYELTPPEETITKLAKVLDLDGPALSAIARNAWHPNGPMSDPDLDLVCLNVFMGTYPVKCYLVRCPRSGVPQRVHGNLSGEMLSASLPSYE